MSDQEMKDIWLSGDGMEKINLDQSQLVDNLNQKTKKLDRTLFFRDFREIIAALFVMCVFGYKAFGEMQIVSKITSAMLVVWAAYIIYRLLDVRKYKKMIDVSQSFKHQLLQQKTYLKQQAHLLDSALSWYVGPFAVILTIRIIGESIADPFMVQLFSYGIGLGILYLFSWGLYALNKKAAKLTYLPLIKNIDEVLVGLDED